LSYRAWSLICFSSFLLAVVFGGTRMEGAWVRLQEVEPQRLVGFTKSEVHMGVRFQISLYTTDEARAEQAFAASFAEIARLEQVFSDYKSESEARRIDLATCDVAIEVSPDMQRVLSHSLAIHHATNGYFDVTLGSLTKLWRTARREKRPPAPAALATAGQRVGSHLLDLQERHLVKRSPGVELDFGGIAKGDAADQALNLLRQKFGITHVLVDASGDLVAGDPPPNQVGWVIELERPADDPGPRTRVSLANQALASSGDSVQFLETDQARWSHLLNPHTKTPIVGQNLTLVWADTGATADALASALAICPAQEFAAITARFPGLVASVYRRTSSDQPTEVLQTENWHEWIREKRIE
jgi:thiamine biosynthesis lipoprotein